MARSGLPGPADRGLSRAMSIAVDQENARALVVAAHHVCAGLLRRYEVSRDPSDLDRATDGYRALLHVMTGPARQRAAVQDNLAAVFRERFALRHDVRDPRAAVNLLREAIQQTPPASGLYVYRCGLLAMSARNLYQATGDLADLDQESSALRDALAAPPTTARCATKCSACSLATYMARYARTQDAADLDRGDRHRRGSGCRGARTIPAGRAGGRRLARPCRSPPFGRGGRMRLAGQRGQRGSHLGQAGAHIG